MDRTIKGEWQTRSDIPNRKERLAAHIEFERSELKQRLDEGWKVESSRVKPRRPRIKKEKPAFKLFGTFEMDIPIEVLIKCEFK